MSGTDFLNLPNIRTTNVEYGQETIEVEAETVEPVFHCCTIGATMVNQFEYDRDRMKLWEVKEFAEPAFTFGSFEPLLGRIILDKHAPDWIICGGETDQGPHKARLADPTWMRYLRDQARDLVRAFFMKQMTNKAPIPDDLLIRQWPVAA